MSLIESNTFHNVLSTMNQGQCKMTQFYVQDHDDNDSVVDVDMKGQIIRFLQGFARG